MADLLKTNVTVLAAYPIGGTTGKARKVVRAKFTNTTAGSAANKLLASAFGLRFIERCSNIFLDATTKRIYPASPEPLGTYINTYDPVQATDANQNIPADIATSTDSAYVTVEGYE